MAPPGVLSVMVQREDRFRTFLTCSSSSTQTAAGGASWERTPHPPLPVGPLLARGSTHSSDSLHSAEWSLPLCVQVTGSILTVPSEGPPRASVMGDGCSSESPRETHLPPC